MTQIGDYDLTKGYSCSGCQAVHRTKNTFPNKLRSLAPLPVVGVVERRRNPISWEIRNSMREVERRGATSKKYMGYGREEKDR